MISFLLATTGRPHEALRTVHEIRTTTVPHEIEIIAAVDHDQLSAAVLSGEVDDLLYSDAYRGCSAAWNAALGASTGELLVLAADDLEFTLGWLKPVLKAMSEFPGGVGFVGFNDGHHDASLSTHYMVHRQFVLEHFGGRIAWEHYRHSFNDVEACQRAQRADRYTWCEAARVGHRHWLWGSRAQDETDQRALVEHAESQQRYQERARNGFPDDLPPVITR